MASKIDHLAVLNDGRLALGKIPQREYGAQLGAQSRRRRSQRQPFVDSAALIALMVGNGDVLQTCRIHDLAEHRADPREGPAEQRLNDRRLAGGDQIKVVRCPWETDRRTLRLVPETAARDFGSVDPARLRNAREFLETGLLMR
jgi:hypothetical protein